ncbi:twitching motility protein PilT [Desulfosarcina ovata subsp. ovata]|uniref:Ribonuclease VapC n=1 Tax=Desulfosarcina ovata subsp. ovata TaxID=2752305 RepID=A0A5K8A5G8_9BACT|nr:twitching motility protein PilT [Desulfosarcina ovata subsp. ovata]
MYLLDTNIVSYWMRGDSAIIQKIQTFSPSDLSLSTVTLAEIYYGIEKSPTRKKERQLKIERIKSQLEIYPFNESAALKYGSIRASLEKQGQPISERDLQIAAIALANKFCVVTHNVKEFRRITDLKVEDWAQD